MFIVLDEDDGERDAGRGLRLGSGVRKGTLGNGIFIITYEMGRGLRGKGMQGVYSGVGKGMKWGGGGDCWEKGCGKGTAGRGGGRGKCDVGKGL